MPPPPTKPDRLTSRAIPRPVEALEPRRLLDALIVDGTIGNDVIAVFTVGSVVTVSVNGVPVSELDSIVDQVIVNALDGNDTIRIGKNTDNQIIINAGAGDDTIRLAEAASSLSALGDPNQTISIFGGAGNDRVEFYDSGRQSAAEYRILELGEDGVRLEVVNLDAEPLAPVIEAADISSAVLLAGAGDDVLRVSDGLAGVSIEIDGGPGNDQFHISGGNPAFPVTAIPGDGQDEMTVAGGVQVYLPGAQTWDRLTIDPDAVVTLGARPSDIAPGPDPDAVASVRSVAMLGNGTVDVSAGTLLIDYSGTSPIDFVRARLISGRAGGSWTGPGIRTTAAIPGTGLGYAEATDLFTTFPAVFASMPIDSTTLIVRFTLLGDANLDRTVNIADFSRLARAFNLPAGWVGGDFNYDGVTNLSDFAALAGNFNRSLTTVILPQPFGGWRLGLSEAMRSLVLD